MAFKFWLSGPRAASSGIRDAADAAKVFIAMRSDGAIAIARDKSPSAEALGLSDKVATPLFLLFRIPGAAEAVVAGALRRLANERMDGQNRWYLDLSVGQAAAALKAEAKALCFSFEVVHPYLRGAPIIGSSRRARRHWMRRAALVGYHAVVLAAGASIGLAVGLMARGS